MIQVCEICGRTEEIPQFEAAVGSSGKMLYLCDTCLEDRKKTAETYRDFAE